MLGHLIALVAIVAAAVALVRWGSVIFIVYAGIHFIAGEWFEAGMAFAIACFIETTKAIAGWLHRCEGYRGRWF